MSLEQPDGANSFLIIWMQWDFSDRRDAIKRSNNYSVQCILNNNLRDTELNFVRVQSGLLKSRKCIRNLPLIKVSPTYLHSDRVICIFWWGRSSYYLLIHRQSTTKVVDYPSPIQRAFVWGFEYLVRHPKSFSRMCHIHYKRSRTPFSIYGDILRHALSLIVLRDSREGFHVSHVPQGVVLEGEQGSG
jgi:hypothetical protein